MTAQNVHLYHACAAQGRVIIMCLDAVHSEAHEHTYLTWEDFAGLFDSTALSVTAASEWQACEMCWHA